MLYAMAQAQGVHERFMFKTWGGLGDRVCAEPAMRYALENFKGVEISLYTEQPELFEHLPFKAVYAIDGETLPNCHKYLMFWSIKRNDSLAWQFYNHMCVHPVDFSSMCMFAIQLPNVAKQIKLPDFKASSELRALIRQETVVVHAGKHWPSKTFPAEWWFNVCDALVKHGLRPLLVGADASAPGENRTFVDFDAPACCDDLRGKTSLREMIYLCKNTPMLLSNDSSPIHIAAAGNAHISMVATCKHPDFLFHWRDGVFGKKTYNLGRDGAWNYVVRNPKDLDTPLSVEFLPEGLMEKILPDPTAVAEHHRNLLSAGT